MSSDIYDIVNEEYSKLGSSISNPIEDRRRKIEKEIMEEILIHSDGGISHMHLAKTIGVDRKTLRKYTKTLAEKKLIVRESTRHGKYYPSTRLHQRKDPTADLIVKSYLRDVFINSNFVIDSPYYRHDEENFIQKLADNDSLDEALFNFSNKIGSFVTYAIIESLNPDNMIAQNVSNKEIINYNLTRWLDDVISTLASFLQPIFKDYIYNYLECLVKKALRNRTEEDPYGDMVYVDYLVKSSHLLDQECITELYSSFFKIYPNLKDPLQKIKSNIPNTFLILF